MKNFVSERSPRGNVSNLLVASWRKDLDSTGLTHGWQAARVINSPAMLGAHTCPRRPDGVWAGRRDAWFE